MKEIMPGVRDEESVSGISVVMVQLGVVYTACAKMWERVEKQDDALKNLPMVMGLMWGVCVLLLLAN